MFELLDLKSAPWVVRAFLGLLFFCFFMIVLAMLLSVAIPESTATIAPVLSLGVDSFKTVLGAVIGSLSLAASYQFKKKDILPVALKEGGGENAEPGA